MSTSQMFGLAIVSHCLFLYESLHHGIIVIMMRRSNEIWSFHFLPFCFIENRIRLKKGFLINGGILPGSSGSPVILKQSHYRQIRK
jgi:hypothetical protein